jgi:hypothetical protein
MSPLIWRVIAMGRAGRSIENNLHGLLLFADATMVANGSSNLEGRRRNDARPVTPAAAPFHRRRFH